jgi:hypothetical protein
VDTHRDVQPFLAELISKARYEAIAEDIFVAIKPGRLDARETAMTYAGKSLVSLWIIRVPARQTGKAHANCYPGFPARHSESPRYTYVPFSPRFV